MSKIYELYPKEQRKIDNQARRIRGYEKMRRDLQSANRKLNRENKELRQRIDKAKEHIEENRDYQDILIGRTQWESGKFFTEDILREKNIEELLEILKGSDK